MKKFFLLILNFMLYSMTFSTKNIFQRENGQAAGPTKDTRVSQILKPVPVTTKPTPSDDPFPDDEDAEILAAAGTGL